MTSERVIGLIVVFTMCSVAGAGISNFDDLTLAPESHWSGNYPCDEVGGTYDTVYFHSGTADYENHSDGDWFCWAGFAYSNETDTTTSGYTNQYSSYTGNAESGTNFAVGYMDSYNGFNPTMILDTPSEISGFYVTNTTYVALSMLNSESPAKKFGGDTGDDADWFLLTITGKDSGGSVTETVDFYLADYRFADNAYDYIIDDWTLVELSSLGTVKSLEFTLSSSDVGAYGMNTPAYFAVDTIVPEPATIALFSIAGLLLRRRRA